MGPATRGGKPELRLFGAFRKGFAATEGEKGLNVEVFPAIRDDRPVDEVDRDRVTAQRADGGRVGNRG